VAIEQPQQSKVIQLSTHLDDLRMEGNATDITIGNYMNNIRTVGIYEIDPMNMELVWQQLLSKFDAGVSYGAIAGFLKVVRKALRLHGHSFVKNHDYNVLLMKLRKCGSKPSAYTTDQLKQILQATEIAANSKVNSKRKPDYSLYKICILCIYAGLRISSIEGLKITSFQKVEGYDAYTFPVFSKGVPYTAIISRNAYKRLDDPFADPAEPIARFDADSKSTFDKIYRSKMIYLLNRYGIAPTMAKNKPFHSMRKYFAEQLAGTPGLHSEDIALLMGHRPPRTTAYRHYIDEQKLPTTKLAEIYCKTPLYHLVL